MGGLDPDFLNQLPVLCDHTMLTQHQLYAAFSPREDLELSQTMEVVQPTKAEEEPDNAPEPPSKSQRTDAIEAEEDFDRASCVCTYHIAVQTKPMQ